MTAEVAIANTGAVALAADSAVTVSNHSGAKVYNTVNKLFSLSTSAPVGVMVWGGADLCGIPWEVLIKEYRRELGETRFESLEEYCADLRRFLTGSPYISDDLQQLSVFRAALALFHNLIVDQIVSRMHEHFEMHGEASRQQVVSIITAVLDERQKGLEAHPLVEGFAARDVGRIATKYRGPIDAAISATFEQLPLGERSRQKIRRIVGLFCCRSFRSPNRSGLVVAGFGESDIFPKIVSHEIDGYWLDRPKMFSAEVATARPDDPAVVIPFAQREMVSLFMEGVDPTYRQVVVDALEGFLSQLPDLVADSVGAVGPQRTGITKGMNSATEQMLKEFRDRLQHHSHHAHVMPIIEAVAALPKDELGAMAESLVNLTSFKRRVTLDAETVGGAIDVAVISKGDGFIWLQRKHYFEMDKNPQFSARYK
jgi:hypothetical protein